MITRPIQDADDPLVATVVAAAVIAPVALAWRWVGSSLVRAYETRLAFWQRELDRTDPHDTAKLAQVRSYIDYYTARLARAADTRHGSGSQGPACDS